MNYDELLERALKKMPQRAEDKGRFEIPRASSITVGNRTIIKNFKEIADTFRRDPNHLLKYLSGELATQGIIEGMTAVCSGRFSNPQINEKVERYAHAYVICHECGKPDTKITKEERVYMLKCEACGAFHPIKTV
jgi:translation initiation factor 2 subunit 2